MEPLVSIVIPSFNQAKFIEDTLLSVVRQDYPRLEVLVIDGGSADGSVEIIRRFEDQLGFWASEPDRGQVDAINKGLTRASGEIVAWINSDDLLLAGAVRSAVQALQAFPQAGMVYADGLMVDGQGQLLDPHHYRPYSLLDLLCFEVLLQPTAFMRQRALREVGYLSENYSLILDHELWIRLAARFPLVHVREFWAVERSHPQAKTIAEAAGFVREAERLIDEAKLAVEMGELVSAHEGKVQASLNAFAARRLIDAGDFTSALKRLPHSFRNHPLVALRYWYKWLQAALGAMGLEGTFMTYRTFRRRLQHRRASVSVGARGAELTRPASSDSGRFPS